MPTSVLDFLRICKVKPDEKSGPLLSFLEWFMPIFIMITTPLIAVFFSFITNKLPGPWYEYITSYSIGEVLYDMFASGGWIGTREGYAVLGVFFLFGLLFYYLPGRKYSCTVTPTGHVPMYIDNGLVHLYLTTAVFLGGVYFEFWKGSVLFDWCHETVLAANFSGWVLCVFLYWKGCTESGSLGKGIAGDFYHGTDHYPRIFGFDLKLLINCRFSMCYWYMLNLSCIFASYDRNKYLDPAVVYCAALQMIYLWKFFLWESGYMNSIDIIMDRGGFMILWGCLCFVPAVYVFATRLLVNVPSEMSWASATLLFAVGIFGISMNYLVDWERQFFRSTHGKKNIWGREPTYLDVTYHVTKSDGKIETRHSMLLTSGFWGFSRHANYIFELVAAYTWCAFSNQIIGMFYAVFLTILLFHRSVRDEMKCLAKYGDGYREYMKKVEYRVIPYIF